MQSLNLETEIYLLQDIQDYQTHLADLLAAKAWLVYLPDQTITPIIKSLTLIAQRHKIFFCFISDLSEEARQLGISLINEQWTRRQNDKLLIANKELYAHQLILQQKNLQDMYEQSNKELQDFNQDYQKKLRFLQNWQATVGQNNIQNPDVLDQIDQPLYQLTFEQKKLFKKHIEQEELLNQSLQAINSKFLLVTADYKVTASNVSPSNSATYCYQLLFNRNQPCLGCHLGKPFYLNNPFFEVSSAELNDKNTKLFINWYKTPIIRKLNELNMTGNSRLTQLGIISASMAHELNNPLAGILSFTQLLLMDKNIPHRWHSDLNLIEQAAQRTRQLIERLLIFAKHHHQTKQQQFTPQQFMELAYEMAKLDIFKQDYPPLEIQVDNTNVSISSEFSNLLLMITELVLQKILVQSELTPIKINLSFKNNFIYLKFQHQKIPDLASIESLDLLKNLKWILSGQIQQGEDDGQKNWSIQFRRPDF